MDVLVTAVNQQDRRALYDFGSGHEQEPLSIRARMDQLRRLAKHELKYHRHGESITGEHVVDDAGQATTISTGKFKDKNPAPRRQEVDGKRRRQAHTKEAMPARRPSSGVVRAIRPVSTSPAPTPSLSRIKKAPTDGAHQRPATSPALVTTMSPEKPKTAAGGEAKLLVVPGTTVTDGGPLDAASVHLLQSLLDAYKENSNPFTKSLGTNDGNERQRKSPVPVEDTKRRSESRLTSVTAGNIGTTAKRDFIVTAPAPSHTATGASRTRTGLRTAVSKTVVMEEVDAYHRQVQQQDAMYRRTYDRMKAEQAAKERMKREQRQKMFERALRGPVASGKRQKPVAKLTKMPDVREVERLADIHGQGGVADDGCVLAEGMAIDHQVAVASSVAPAQQQSPSQSTRSLVIFPEPQTANHGMCSTNSLPAASMTLYEQPTSLSTSMQSLRTSMQELVAHNQGKPLPLTTSHRRLLPRAGSHESVASSVRSSSKITKGTSSRGNLDNTTHLIRNMTAADVAAIDDCLRRLNMIESSERRIQSNLVDADRVYATDSAAIGAYGCVGMSLPAPLSLARDHLSNSTLHVDAPPRRRGRPRRDITLSEDTAMRIREAQHARRSHELDLMKRYPLPADVTAWELQEKLATDILGEVADEVVGEYHVALDWIVDDLIREEFE